MNKCLFCRIITKEIPSKFVYEDEKVVAFNDISPQAPVHILIATKKHIKTVMDLSEEDEGLTEHIMKVSKKLALKYKISESGFRLVVNCNENGGQEVMHIHFHLLGGRMMQWPPG